MDTASSSEAEPVTAVAPSERSSTVKEKATGTDRKKSGGETGVEELCGGNLQK